MIGINSDTTRRLGSRFTPSEDVPTITANDSLSLLDSQQKRKTNRVHNQRKNTGKIVWNDV
jgi:hypothetical protein